MKTILYLFGILSLLTFSFCKQKSLESRDSTSVDTSISNYKQSEQEVRKEGAQLKPNEWGVINVDFADKSLTNGLVYIIDYKKDINFYLTLSDTLNPIHKLSFIETDQGIEIKEEANQAKWLIPQSMGGGVCECSFLMFRLLAVKDNWLKVVVNNMTGIAYWIKYDEGMNYLNWQNFLETQNIFISKDFPQQLRSLPTLSSKEIKHSDSNNNGFNCLRLEGDWMNVIEVDGNKISGWVKWKSGNQILIHFEDFY